MQNAWDNPLFRNNTLVESHGLRFYAGVPLVARHGEVLGTLCILDVQPRMFTHGDLELLSHAMSPEIPRSAFRYLEYVDRDLDIFGAAAFRDLAVVEGVRSCESGRPVSCAVIAVPARRLREVTRKLEARYPRSLERRSVWSRAWRCVWAVPWRVSAVPAVSSQIEQLLGDAGLA